MTFSLSGTTITQSGTDSDLSGLSAITGVSVTSNGYATVYGLPTGVNLEVTGEITHNPENEELWFDAVATGTAYIKIIGSSAVYHYGYSRTLDGETIYTCLLYTSPSPRD